MHEVGVFNINGIKKNECMINIPHVDATHIDEWSGDSLKMAVCPEEELESSDVSSILDDYEMINAND